MTDAKARSVGVFAAILCLICLGCTSGKEDINMKSSSAGPDVQIVDCIIMTTPDGYKAIAEAIESLKLLRPNALSSEADSILADCRKRLVDGVTK